MNPETDHAPQLRYKRTMRNERDVKHNVKAAVLKRGGWYTMPQTGGYGRSGIPDILICYRGRFVAVECKFGSNKPTALQKKELTDIKNADGIALVLRESNWEDIFVYLNTVDREIDG